MLRALLVTLALLQADACLAWQVSNKVVIEHGKLSIDHSKSIAEITKAQASGGFASGHGLGLFQSRIKTELAIEQPAPQRLALTTRLRTDPVIYVAREYPEGSCAYAVVLNHERQHQLFDLEVLRALPEEIQAITRQVFSRDQQPLDLERARKWFFQRYKYAYDSRSVLLHQSIDNPDSYRRLSALCGGELTRGLGAETPAPGPSR